MLKNQTGNDLDYFSVVSVSAHSHGATPHVASRPFLTVSTISHHTVPGRIQQPHNLGITHLHSFSDML